MKTCFPSLLLALVACCLSAAFSEGQTVQPSGTDKTFDPAYDHPSEGAPASPDSDSRVSLFREPGGKLILVVNYPWKLHARPSVEVRLLGQGEPEDLKIQPMYFRWKHMKGDTTVAVYRCQDGCEDYPVSAPVRDREIEFNVLGDRNSLGTPAVCAARSVVRQEVARKSSAKGKPGAAAAFPLLEPWAVSKELLYLDLPEGYFADAGTMRVWFLRDDQVLWSETLSWPGLDPSGTKPQAAPATDEPAEPTHPKPSPTAAPKPKHTAPSHTAPKARPKAEPKPRPEPKARPKKEPRPKAEPKPRSEKRPKKGKQGQEPGF